MSQWLTYNLLDKRTEYAPLTGLLKRYADLNVHILEVVLSLDDILLVLSWIANAARQSSKENFGCLSEH